MDLLRDTVRSYLSRRPDASWSDFAGELGVAGLTIPEEYGGADCGPAEIALVAWELGRVLSPHPFLQTAVLAVEALKHDADEPSRARLLPTLADGTTSATVIFTPPPQVPASTPRAHPDDSPTPSAHPRRRPDPENDARPDTPTPAARLDDSPTPGAHPRRRPDPENDARPDTPNSGAHPDDSPTPSAHHGQPPAPGSHARPDTPIPGARPGALTPNAHPGERLDPEDELRLEDGLLTGVAPYVPDGDVVLIYVGGLLVEAVPATRQPYTTMDATRPLSRLVFDRTPATILGTAQHAERVRDLGIAALSAEQAGGAERCLETAVEYAKQRRQFGRPIGSFQAIKHKLADVLLLVESARSAALSAHESATNAAIAGAYCTEAYLQAAGENIQVHGGIGITWEHDAHRYFKRATSDAQLFRSPRAHREHLSAQLF